MQMCIQNVQVFEEFRLSFLMQLIFFPCVSFLKVHSRVRVDFLQLKILLNDDKSGI